MVHARIVAQSTSPRDTIVGLVLVLRRHVGQTCHLITNVLPTRFKCRMPSCTAGQEAKFYLDPSRLTFKFPSRQALTNVMSFECWLYAGQVLDLSVWCGFSAGQRRLHIGCPVLFQHGAGCPYQRSNNVFCEGQPVLAKRWPTPMAGMVPTHYQRGHVDWVAYVQFFPLPKVMSFSTSHESSSVEYNFYVLNIPKRR